jgi:hypothetical protein
MFSMPGRVRDGDAGVLSLVDTCVRLIRTNRNKLSRMCQNYCRRHSTPLELKLADKIMTGVSGTLIPACLRSLETICPLIVDNVRYDDEYWKLAVER